jgi:hypothetical protein
MDWGGDNMTKEELEGIRALKKEIEQIKNELRDLPMVFDTVQGCTPTRWDKHVITIRGRDVRRETRLKAKLEITLDELQEKLLLMEEWLDSVSDGEMRVILRMKYRSGMKEKQIADELGYDKSTISKKLSKFFSAA